MYVVYNSNAGEYENCGTLEQVKRYIEEQCRDESNYEDSDFIVYKESHSAKLERSFRVDLLPIK